MDSKGGLCKSDRNTENKKRERYKRGISIFYE